MCAFYCRGLDSVHVTYIMMCAPQVFFILDTLDLIYLDGVHGYISLAFH